MHPALEDFVILKADPRVSKLDGSDLRTLEKRLLGNPDDAKTIDELKERHKELLAAYRFVVPRHVSMCVLPQYMRRSMSFQKRILVQLQA